MFPLFPGWKLLRHAGRSLLVTPCGGAICVEEGLRPVATIAELVRGLRLPAGCAVAEASIEELVTDEGEYGGLARGRAGDAALCFGFVLRDESYVRFVGRAPLAAASALAAAVREIVIATRVYLGEARQRRFRFRAPSGWRALETAGEQTWVPRDYPERRSAITLLPALPAAARSGAAAVAGLLCRDEIPGALSPAMPIATRRGLAGWRWQLRCARQDGVGVDVQVVALSDGRFDYLARLIVGAAEEDRAVFGALLDSIEPVPAPRPQFVNDAMEYWTR
jgi:hypothetical protein